MARERESDGFPVPRSVSDSSTVKASHKENILTSDIVFDILFLCAELNPPQLFIRAFYLCP